MAPSEPKNYRIDRPEGVVEFNGTNFQVWRNQLEIVFTSLGLALEPDASRYPVDPLETPGAYYLCDPDYRQITKFNASRARIPDGGGAGTSDTGLPSSAPTSGTMEATPALIASRSLTPLESAWAAAIARHGPRDGADYYEHTASAAPDDDRMGRLCTTNSVADARLACKDWRAALLQWDKNIGRVKSMVQRTISPTMLSKLDLNSDEATAKTFTAADILRVCKAHHVAELSMNKARHINELRGIKARAGETVDQLAARIKEAANNVKLHGDNSLSDDDEQRRILLNAIATRYPMLEVVLQTDCLSLDKAVARLKLQESLDAERGAGGSGRRPGGGEAKGDKDVVALAAHGNYPAQSKKTKGTASTKDTKCYNCDKMGHFSRDCRAPRRERTDRKQGGFDKSKTDTAGFHVALQAHAEGDDTLQAESWVVATRDSAEADEADYLSAILDSGATNHMFSRKNVFLTYAESTTDRSVVVANGSIMPVAGTGMVHVQAFNEDRGMWQTVRLTNALHVPDLAAELLSVSQIVKKGYRVTFLDKIARVDVSTGPLPYHRAILAGEKVKGSYRILCRLPREPDDARIDRTDVTPWSVWPDARNGAATVARISATPPDQGSGGGTEEAKDSSDATGVVATAAVANSDRAKQALELWHARLGHLGLGSLMTLARKDLVDGIDFSNWAGLELDVCEACVYGKTTRAGFPTGGERSRPTTRPLELVHSDLCGKFPVTSFRGALYYVSFVDDFTRHAWVYFLNEKSDARDAFKHFRAAVERDGANKIGTLRTDGGGEYDNGILLKHLANHGIKWEHSSPHSPEQNGLAERFNRTILDKVRAMLKQADLPPRYWAEAVAHAVHLYNRAPHRAITGVTPHEKYTGLRPDLADARIFGCDAYAFLHPGEARRKLDDRAVKLVYLGWSTEAKGYKLCNAHGVIKIARSVKFDERRVIANIKAGHNQAASSPATSSTPTHLNRIVTFDELNRPVDHEADGGAEGGDFLGQQEEHDKQEEHDEQEEHHDHEKGDPGPAQLNHGARVDARGPTGPRTSGRKPAGPSAAEKYLADIRKVAAAKAPRAYPTDAFVFVADSSGQVIIDPTSYKNALASSHAADWRKAVGAEFVGLLENGTFTVEAVPGGRKTLTGKWVLTTKTKSDGTLLKFKARFVARGFQQIAGIDYGEVFAPVTRYTTIRLIAAMATDPALFTAHSDIKQAYLNGTLDEDLYLEPPEGTIDILLAAVDPANGHSAAARDLARDMINSLNAAKRDGIRVALRLHKTLYGLKQAGREWNRLLDATLRAAGFVNHPAELCLYIKRVGTSWVLVAVYVDDLAWLANDEKMLRACQGVLGARFIVTDLGALAWFLGMAITRKAGIVTIDQGAYITDALEKFGMVDCNALSTPIDTSERLTKDMAPINDIERADMAAIPYRSAVGTLMYLAISTRPDIAVAVNMAARYLENPGPRHWAAVKRIFRYLKGTRNLGLKYTFGGHKNEIVGFCDADWGGDTDTRRSNTGYTFLLHGAAISWQSKAQTTVALSSSEAEYMAAGAAAREALWFRELAEFIGLPLAGALTVYTDSQGALGMINSEAVKATSKHISIRAHFIRDHVAKGNLLYVYVSTTEMAADCLTKGLSADNLRYTRGLLGLGTVGADHGRADGGVGTVDGARGAFGAFVRGGVLGPDALSPSGSRGEAAVARE